jgi:hypothetical protein
MKKLGILITLLLAFSLSANAQLMRAIPESGFIWNTDYGTGITVKGPGDSACDSASWDHTYFFDIPEGMVTDTLQLLIWCRSDDGAVDIDLSATYAVRVGGKIGKSMSDTTLFKLSGTETTLKTTHTTESLKAYQIVAAAEDTLMNGTTTKDIMPTAVLIEVDAGGATQSDTQYWIGVVGKKGLLSTSK